MLLVWDQTNVSTIERFHKKPKVASLLSQSILPSCCCVVTQCQFVCMLSHMYRRHRVRGTRGHVPNYKFEVFLSSAQNLIT